jgi:hypothetical protein
MGQAISNRFPKPALTIRYLIVKPNAYGFVNRGKKTFPPPHRVHFDSKVSTPTGPALQAFETLSATPDKIRFGLEGLNFNPGCNRRAKGDSAVAGGRAEATGRVEVMLFAR